MHVTTPPPLGRFCLCEILDCIWAKTITCFWMCLSLWCISCDWQYFRQSLNTEKGYFTSTIPQSQITREFKCLFDLSIDDSALLHVLLVADVTDVTEEGNTQSTPISYHVLTTNTYNNNKQTENSSWHLPIRPDFA